MADACAIELNGNLAACGWAELAEGTRGGMELAAGATTFGGVDGLFALTEITCPLGIWTESMPSLARTSPPASASALSLSAASTPIEKVTRTEFHGSIFLTRSRSSEPLHTMLLSSLMTDLNFLGNVGS